MGWPSRTLTNLLNPSYFSFIPCHALFVVVVVLVKALQVGGKERQTRAVDDQERRDVHRADQDQSEFQWGKIEADTNRPRKSGRSTGESEGTMMDL